VQKPATGELTEQQAICGVALASANTGELCEDTEAMTKRGNESPYDWPNLRIVAESTDHTHLDWLDEFLKPSFAAESTRSRDYTVRLLSDDDRYRKASESCLANGDNEIDVFVQDSSVVRLPAVRVQGRWEAFDKNYRAVYCVRDFDPAVEIIHPSASAAVRGGLMRVVRELAMNHALREGDYILHAASVKLNHEGVIIAGPKGAGKTTLLVHLLGAENARYVTNDRLLVYTEDGSARVRGVPTIVCLREELFRFFPGLRERLFNGWYRWLLTLKECAAKPPPPPGPWPDGRIGISPAQLCSLRSRPAIEAANPRTIVFPEITRRAGTVHLTPLSADETAVRLHASLFAAGHGTARSGLFGNPTRPPQPRRRLREACDQLARSLRGYRCELGLDVKYTMSCARLLAEKLTGA
jgi:energy-coupling factor transporter ATP-binding protein EcfA2